jgi:hypothetical protein
MLSVAVKPGRLSVVMLDVVMLSVSWRLFDNFVFATF